MTAIQDADDQALATVREAMHADEVRLTIVPIWVGPSKEAVRIETKVGAARWKKQGPLIFPPDGGTIVDVLRMLGEMRVGS